MTDTLQLVIAKAVEVAMQHQGTAAYLSKYATLFTPALVLLIGLGALFFRYEPVVRLWMENRKQQKSGRDGIDGKDGINGVNGNDGAPSTNGKTYQTLTGCEKITIEIKNAMKDGFERLDVKTDKVHSRIDRAFEEMIGLAKR